MTVLYFTLVADGAMPSGHEDELGQFADLIHTGTDRDDHFDAAVSPHRFQPKQGQTHFPLASPCKPSAMALSSNAVSARVRMRESMQQTQRQRWLAILSGMLLNRQDQWAGQCLSKRAICEHWAEAALRQPCADGYELFASSWTGWRSAPRSPSHES